MRAFLIAIILVLALPFPLAAVTPNSNATAFPLPGNVLFPARIERTAIFCQNPTTNAAVTITYSGFSIVLQPGGYWERVGQAGGFSEASGVPQGIITATGTAAQTLRCLEIFR